MILALLTAVTAVRCGGGNGTTFAPTGPGSAQARFQGTVTSVSRGTTAIDLSLFIQELPVALAPAPPQLFATLLAQATRTANVSGSFVTGDGITGTIRGNITGTLVELQLVQGVFDGTLTASGTDGCVEERVYRGPNTSAGLDWTAGALVRTCPQRLQDFAVIQVPRSSAAPGAPVSFPTIRVTPTGTGVQHGTSFTFELQNVSNGSTLRWDFGDGTSTATAGPVTHVFARSGSFRVRVRRSSEQAPIAQTEVRIKSLLGAWTGTITGHRPRPPARTISSFTLTVHSPPPPPGPSGSTVSVDATWIDSAGCRVGRGAPPFAGFLNQQLDFPVQFGFDPTLVHVSFGIEQFLCGNDGDFWLTGTADDAFNVVSGTCPLGGPQCRFRMRRTGGNTPAPVRIDPPVALRPIGGVVVGSLTPTLFVANPMITGRAGRVLIEIHVSTDNRFMRLVRSARTAMRARGETGVPLLRPLQASTAYYWRARATNEDQPVTVARPMTGRPATSVTSDWSQTATFRTPASAVVSPAPGR